MEIERYDMSLDADDEIVAESSLNGDWVDYEDVKQILKEYDLLREFYDTVSKEADWTYRRLK